jgi:hypothetical protein
MGLNQAAADARVAFSMGRMGYLELQEAEGAWSAAAVQFLPALLREVARLRERPEESAGAEVGIDRLHHELATLREENERLRVAFRIHSLSP